MAWNTRIGAFVAVVLLLPSLSTVVGVGGPVGSSAAIGICTADCKESFNATITDPAYLYLDLQYYDGGINYHTLELSDFFIRIISTGAGGPFLYHAVSNPVPVHNSGTVNVTILSKSNLTHQAVLYTSQFASGAAGSVRVINIVFDTNAMTNATFVPVDLIFRPYDRTTGAGLPIEQFNITVQFATFSVALDDDYTTVTYHANNETAVGLGRLSTVYGVPIIVRVRDYFGNLLYEENKTWRIADSQFCMRTTSDPSPTYWDSCGAVTTNYETWDLPLVVYSFKVYNQKPDQFIKAKLYWNGTGAGEEVFATNSGLFPAWWDSNYLYRQRIKINTSQAVPDGYVYNLTLDAASYVAAGKMQADYRDLRVVYWTGSAWVEAPRALTGTNLTWEQQETVGRSEVSPAAGAWRFDEATGTSSADASGNGNTASLVNGPTWTYGVSGSSVSLDGTNDYVALGSGTSLNLNNGFTIEAWIKASPVGSGVSGAIVAWGEDATGKRRSMIIWDGGSGSAQKLYFSGYSANLAGTTTIDDNVWHHAAITLDASNVAKVYVDGVLEASASVSLNSYTFSGAYIGSSQLVGDANGEYFTGLVDEPRIYNYVRTPAQISCDYLPKNCVALAASTTSRDYWLYYGNPLSGAPAALANASYRAEVDASSPRAYWHFDEGTGTKAADASGNSNTGTLTSGPTWSEGFLRNAINYDGSNDYVQYAESTSLDITGKELTIEGWVNRTDATKHSIVLAKRTAGNIQYQLTWFINSGGGANKLGFDTKMGGALTSFASTKAFGAVGTYHHVAVTYDGANVRFYFDGEDVGATAETRSIEHVTTDVFTAWDGPSNFAFSDAFIDEISIYARAFSQTEIWAHRNASLNHPTLKQPPWATLDVSRGFEWYQSPTETAERLLNPGYYEIQIVVDNRTGVPSRANLGFNISEANYLMVDGLNLTRIVGDFESITHQIIIFGNAFRPSVINYGQMLPSAPSQIKFMSAPEQPEGVDPRSVLEGTTVYIGAAGTNVTSFMPNIDQEVDSVAVLNFTTVKQDQFVFTGAEPTITHVWINYTSNGTNIWENASLPPIVTLDGIQGDVYVVTNRTVQTTRISSFQTQWDFTVSRDASTRRYYVTIALNNTMNRTIYEPYWFVAFPEGSTIDLATAAVKDLDNNVWLTAGSQYAVTQAGYYLTFPQLNSSTRRAFYFEYFDANGSEDASTPIITINEIARDPYQGNSAFWSGTAAWSNPSSLPYRGELVIKLRCSECEKVDLSSVVVVDKTRGITLDETQFFTEDGQIKITAAGVGEVVVGGAREYKVYFKLELVPDKTEFSFFEPVFGIFSFFLLTVIVALVALMGLATAPARYQGESKKQDRLRSQGAWTAVLIASLAITFTFWILRAQQVAV